MSTAQQVISRTFAPAGLVGKVYARERGSSAAPMSIGNVLELELSHKEDVQTQQDMTRLGGGQHAEIRRVTEVEVKMKLADLNANNLARASLGTVTGVEAGTVTDEAHTVTLGGLLRTAHIAPEDVEVRIAGAGGAVVPAAGNWEATAAGVVVFANAAVLADGAEVVISYKHGSYAVIEALTTKAKELELIFEGLNEADDGKPCIVEIWRASQGVASSIGLMADKGFASLPVSGAILRDDSKQGASISRFYRVSKV